MFDIEIQIAAKLPKELSPDLSEVLETAVIATLSQQQVLPPASLTLLLTNDDQLQQLNRDFRQIDKTTDVLSFPDGSQIPGVGKYLGDIAISVPQALRQAQTAEQPVLAELKLLTVHGVLHLLGHDHAEAADEKRMWAAQNSILATLT